MILNPHQAMKLAIEEAKKGAGFVSPNPLVGCVITDREHKLIGKGAHLRVGQNHAEVNAVADVKDPAALEGANVYVTLEPCAHEGRTPSCAKMLAKLPLASVTYGVEDPNPLVSGQGAKILREAGINARLFEGDLKHELEETAEIFFTNMREKRPFISVKVASSLDGKVALSNGNSQWITGEESRAHVQYLRGCYDAVVTGTGTFFRDDPRLNSRDPRFSEKNQRVVLLDPEGKSFAKLNDSNLLKVREPGDVIIVTGPTGRKAPEGFKHLEIPDAQGSFDFTSLLLGLQNEGVNSLFVEAGPYTASQFLLSRLTDRLYVFVAPVLLGEGLNWTSGFTLNSLDQSILLQNPRTEKFGADILVTGRPQTRFV